MNDKINNFPLKKTSSIKKKWEKFTHRTTFHGIKNIFETNISYSRQIFWILIVLCALTLFILQVTLRRIHFRKKEAAVNVEVIYADELEFPTVTICNQNRFRLSKIAEFGYYTFFQTLYNTELQNKTKYLKNLAANYSSLDVQKLKYRAIHQAKDFVHSCWLGEIDCTQQFSTTITDYGVCYTIHNKSFKVTESGRATALSLWLNVEHYEHVFGYHNNPGFKILLHNNHFKSLVSDLGFLVAPGMNTLVSIKKTEFHQLNPPHGNCQSSRFKSHLECIDSCRMQMVFRKCQCTPFLAEMNGVRYSNISQNCSFWQEFDCIEREMKNFSLKAINCKCFSPCFSIVYEPSLSSSSISRFSAGHGFLHNESLRKNLEENLSTTLEYAEFLDDTRRRRNDKIFTPFLRKFQNFLSGFSELSEFLNSSKNSNIFNDFEQSIRNDITLIVKNLELLIKVKNSVLYKDFMSKIYKVPAFYISFLILNQTIVNNIKNLLPCLEKTPNNTNLILDCINMDNVTLLDAFLINLTEVYKSKDEIIQELNMLSISYRDYPKTIQKFATKEFNDEILENIIKKCQKDLKEINDLYEDFKKTLNLLHEANSIDDRSKGAVYFIYFFEKLNTLEVNYLKNEYCHLDIEIDNRKNLYTIYDKLNKYLHKVASYNKSLKIIFEDVDKLILFHESLKKFMERTTLTEQPKKKDLIDILNKDRIFSKIYELRNTLTFIDNLLREFQDIAFEIYDTYNSNYKSKWNKFFQPLPSSMQLLKFFKVYGQQIETDLTSCSSSNLTSLQYGACFLRWSIIINIKATNITLLLKEKISPSISTFLDVNSELKSFEKVLIVDDDFFLRNFAKVDIFYQELSYQKIIQIKTFEYLSFLSEIGGLMGMLLGGSVVTLIEFIEFFITINYTSVDAFNVQTEAIHHGDDFIYRCSWAGANCLQNFHPVYTDYGICQSFNTNKSIIVTEWGRANALSLLLNIEQYEHMPGPDNGAGLKILLHDDHDKPLVSDLGFVVSTGMHTIISVKRTEIHSLSPPYGYCENSHFKSHAECVDFCRIQIVVKKCQCRPLYLYYMWEFIKMVNSCSLGEEFLCFENELNKLKYKKINCDCHMPCFQVSYQPSISSSAISKISVEKDLFQNESLLENLKESVQKSLEYTEVLEEEVIMTHFPNRSYSEKIITKCMKRLTILEYHLGQVNDIISWLQSNTTKAMAIEGVYVMTTTIEVINSLQFEEDFQTYCLINKKEENDTILFLERLPTFKEQVSQILAIFFNVQKELRIFEKNTYIDEDFFLRNFVKVEIFYKEMSYEKITQMKKFEFLAFISEIGGFMGLLLGASVVTIIEFIEFFFLKVINKVYTLRKRYTDNEDKC
ncbi:DgyrCDS12265 [Dimorphilus gyrociliatus]|uniref:DgyrCDS12265 n=1 Tax=Dimorphilus gyrociliatus TaxID=2664684 RepID=A0A7I8W800_9ANNE|nr:DgyrCDS12265 [Dimorphilus gyrociliatus]